MYLRCEREAAIVQMKSVLALNPPDNATHVEIQADTQNVRYTMDGSSQPTLTHGMIFVANADPKLFLIEDLRRIRFTRAGGADGALNFHYLAGRDI